jgi:hypothetical protein
VGRKLPSRDLLYVDLFGIKTAEDFCRRLVNSVVSLENKAGFLESLLSRLSQLKPAITIDPNSGSPSFSIDPTVKIMPNHIVGLMNLISEESQSKKIVVVFDEFQDILNVKNANDYLVIMRNVIQFHSDIPYMFAGSSKSALADIFLNRQNPFYKSALTIDVAPLNQGLFSIFISNKFEAGDRTIEGNAIYEIFKIAENCPGDIQQLCSAIWEMTDPGFHIDEVIIPAALQLVFARELKMYESHLGLLTSHQFRCLSGLARLGGRSPFSSQFLRFTGIGQPSSVTRALTRLIQLGIVSHIKTEYRFTNPFFKAWLVYKNL